MHKSFGKLCRRAVGFALVMTLGLALLPFAVFPAASFLGKDVSQLAAGVVSFYPWSAVAEVVKIIAVALTTAFAAGLVAAAASAWLHRGRWLMFPGMPVAAYALWLVGTVLRYPALFEASVPERVQRGIFHLGFYLTPEWLFRSAAGLMLLPVAILSIGCYQAWSAAQLRRRGGMLALALALAWLACSWEERDWRFWSTAHPPQDKANVLLIGIDSLRLDRLARAEVTPALQALLADPQALLCRDHYVGIPRTFPSWIEMLQGLPAPSTGIRHMFPGFGERAKPFAGWVSLLRQAGYRTTVRSDFAGDIFPRFQAGFDEVYAPKLTIMTMIRLNMDQAFLALLPLMTTGPWQGLFGDLKESPAFGDPQQLGEGLRARLNKDPGGPWLETIFFSTAHFPYAAPYPYYAMFADRHYAGPFRFQKNPELAAGNDHADAAEVAQVRALYDGAVRSIDAELARIFAELKAKGLWEQTMIIVTADHGEDLFERDNLQGHGEHLRGVNVLKVPLLIKLPARQKAAVKALDFTTRSIDLGATVLGALGMPQRVGEGIDLSPWMVGAKPPESAPQLTAYAETGLWFARTGSAYFQQQRLDYPGISGLLNFDQGYSGEITLNPAYQQVMISAKHRMMIDGDYKLLYMPTPAGLHYELYNRRTDPDNRHDLSAAEPARVAALRLKLLDFIAAHEGRGAAIVDDFLVPK